MEFEHLDQHVPERNLLAEGLFWKAFEDRGYEKEWILNNTEKIHVLNCCNSNTYIFSVDEEELFSITCHMTFDGLDGGIPFHTEYTITHL